MSSSSVLTSYVDRAIAQERAVFLEDSYLHSCLLSL